MAIDEDKYNDAILKASILDWVMDALAGNGVCDFAESFIEVSAAMAVRNTLECIANGCAGPDFAAKGTLALLGNFDPK